MGSEHRAGVALDSGAVHPMTGGKAEDSGTAGQWGPAGACGSSAPTAAAEGGALEVCLQREAKAGLGEAHVLGKYLMRLGASERAHGRAVC